MQQYYGSRPFWAQGIVDAMNQGVGVQAPGMTRPDGGRYSPLPEDPSAPLPADYAPQGTPGSPYRNPAYAGMNYNDRQRQYWVDQFGSDQGWNQFQRDPAGYANNQARRDARTQFYQNQWDQRMGQNRMATKVGGQTPKVNAMRMQSPATGQGSPLVSALSRAQQPQMRTASGQMAPGQPQGKAGFQGPVTRMPPGQGSPGPIRQNPPPNGKGGFGGSNPVSR